MSFTIGLCASWQQKDYISCFLACYEMVIGYSFSFKKKIWDSNMQGKVEIKPAATAPIFFLKIFTRCLPVAIHNMQMENPANVSHTLETSGFSFQEYKSGETHSSEYPRRITVICLPIRICFLFPDSYQIIMLAYIVI